MKKTTRKIAIFEIVWYAICTLLALWGLTFLVLGIIARNYPSFSNDLIAFNNATATKTNIDLVFWGIIIIAVGVILATIVLCIYGKTADRNMDRETRRKARIAAAKNQTAE